VFGKLKPDEVDAKIVEIAKIKQKDLSVIIILPSIAKCDEMEQQFKNCYIFGKGRVAE